MKIDVKLQGDFQYFQNLNPRVGETFISEDKRLLAVVADSARVCCFPTEKNHPFFSTVDQMSGRFKKVNVTISVT